MDPVPSPGIQRLAAPDGARWVLPRRQLGPLRWLAAFLIPFGLVFSGSGVIWACGLAATSGGPDLFHVALALIGVPLFLAGLVPLALGLAVLGGHSEIEIQAGRLRSIERAGPFHWSWSRPVDKLRRLQVHIGKGQVNGRPIQHGPLAELAALEAQFDGARSLVMALGYPRAPLLALADELAQYCRLSNPQPTLGGASPAVEVIHHDSDDAEEPGEVTAPQEVPPQPTGSDIRLDQRPDGLTLTVPARGFWKGSAGLGCFSVAWLAFCAVFVVAALQGGVTVNSRSLPLGALLAFALFPAVGLAMFIAALTMARRKAIIDVIGGADAAHPATLLVTHGSVFGNKQHQWPADQLQAIRVGPSGTSVNGKPLMQLHIVPRAGRRLGLFTGRKDEELRWLASLLRAALGTPG
jgi:hypothetical protein